MLVFYVCSDFYLILLINVFGSRIPLYWLRHQKPKLLFDRSYPQCKQAYDSIHFLLGTTRLTASSIRAFSSSIVYGGNWVVHIPSPNRPEPVGSGSLLRAYRSDYSSLLSFVFSTLFNDKHYHAANIILFSDFYNKIWKKMEYGLSFSSELLLFTTKILTFVSIIYFETSKSLSWTLDRLFETSESPSWNSDKLFETSKSQS